MSIDDEVRARIKALKASPEFLTSQHAECFAMLGVIEGSLETLRAGLARLNEPHLMVWAKESQHRLLNIANALSLTDPARLTRKD